MAEQPLVILTGAGISKESGLDTFRDADGIWAKHRIEDVATPEAFARNPDLVHRFYNARRTGLVDPAIQPNAAHHALVELEIGWRGPFLLVTQNVDDLHDRAGSKALIHMHGSLVHRRCISCHNVQEYREDIETNHACPTCSAVGTLRPDVVWFGEMPRDMDRIYQALESCEMFISIGTSATVYPAAGFVDAAKGAGARTIEVNLEPTSASDLFDEQLSGPATTSVPDLVRRLLDAK